MMTVCRFVFCQRSFFAAICSVSEALQVKARHQTVGLNFLMTRVS